MHSELFFFYIIVLSQWGPFLPQCTLYNRIYHVNVYVKDKKCNNDNNDIIIALSYYLASVTFLLMDISYVYLCTILLYNSAIVFLGST